MFKRVSSYMCNNKLKMNEDKTHVLVVNSRRKKSLYGDYGVVLQTGDGETVSPTDTERLLGCQLSNNFTWDLHIIEVAKKVARKITCLERTSKYASFKVRRLLANGVIQSHLSYVAPVWGSLNNKLLNIMQKLQNRAARVVTGKGIRTPIIELLAQVGWLSVKQMVVNQDLIQTWKIVNLQKPLSLYHRLDGVAPRRTRLAKQQNIRPPTIPLKTPAKNGFVPRAASEWNKIPALLAWETDLKTFKKGVKEWVTRNVGLN
jgi:hypothetical protein